MKGVLGLILLTLGVLIAASSGARNGERHIRYRQAVAAVNAAEQAERVVAQGRRLNAQLAAEGIDVSPPTVEEALALMEREPRLKKQIDANNEAIQALAKWDLGDGPPSEIAHVAERQRDAIGLPGPSERLRQWFAVGGLGWLAGLGLIVVGGVLARMQLRDENAGGAEGSAGRVDLSRTLTEAQEQLEQIAAMIADLPMDDDAPAARAAIDRLVDLTLNPLVEGRGQLIARHGLATFAEYFGPFSSAERNVNRAWSALTDGHAVVARTSIAAARQGFRDAQVAWDAVESRRATGVRPGPAA